METFYLIDFENVHNDGIANIESMTKEEHVHIFSTQNATNIRQDIFWLKEDRDIKPHLVPVRKQSLDMHLVSYLGYLLGVYGKECSYVIISKDKDYDNIVKFWKEEGYPNISRKEKWPGTASTQRQKTQTVSQTKSNVQTVNSKISAGMAYEFEGDDRSELNLFMQHGLVEIGYDRSSANRICKFVIAHCNDERMLNRITMISRTPLITIPKYMRMLSLFLRNLCNQRVKSQKENRRFVLSLVSTFRRKYMWIAKRKSFRLF